MGLEAGKLGVTIGTQYGDKTVGGLVESGGNMFSSSGTAGTEFASGMSPVLSNLSLGSFVGGGLAGYGASNLISKKKKGFQVAAGTGAGALLGALSGGVGGAISGGLGGAFGSLF
jgi:hypothetical protein